MISKVILAVSVLSGVGILWILNFTTPSSTGPIGVLVLFILTFLFFAGLISAFLYGVNRLFEMVFSSFRKDDLFISKKREFSFFYRYALALAMSPLVLLAQQSIRSVGIFEIILIVVLEIIACLYISKR